MATQERGPQKSKDVPVSPTGEADRGAQPRRPYQTPELHELGTLAKLQRYGFNYNDGSRYKDDY